VSKHPLRDTVWSNLRRGWVAYAVLLLLFAAILLGMFQYDAWRWANGTPTIATVTAIYTRDWAEIYEPVRSR
jgi:hypothetical protein